MDYRSRLQATILSTIIRDLPHAFWQDFRARSRQVYLDEFHEVLNDQNLVPNHRLHKLVQDRQFRMENLLATVALEHSLTVTPTLVIKNNRSFVYVTNGDVGLTQSYVKTIGAMPKPARFREQHAAMNNISRSPRLDLGDEPSKAILGKDFYGIITHNPVGRHFDEDCQRLGMMQFCVPFDNCSEWAAELAIEEILSAYDDAKPVHGTDRRLPWKESAGKKESDEK